MHPYPLYRVHIPKGGWWFGDELQKWPGDELSRKLANAYFFVLYCQRKRYICPLKLKEIMSHLIARMRAAGRNDLVALLCALEILETHF